MELIPVLDLANGVAVHARGGDRANYRPVRSVLAPEREGDALLLSRRFREQLGAARCYAADLDALTGGQRQISLISRLADPVEGFGPGLIVDAAVSDAGGVRSLERAGASTVIVALESLPGPESLEHLLRHTDPRSVIVSLDLRSGVPIVKAGADWPERHDAVALARTLHGLGAERLLILDLARVGRKEGPPFETITAIRAALPEAELLAGGGVRDAADLDHLSRLGVGAALVATALHDGRLADYIARR